MDIHFIGGKRLGSDGETIQVVSPVTGELWFSFPSADEQTVDSAVASAVDAATVWSQTPLEFRIDILQAYAKLLEEHTDELIAAISQEAGKPRWEAATEAKTMVGKIQLSINAHQQRCAEFGTAPSKTRFKPHGVLAVFGPFNFPGHLQNGHVVPSLLAGNTVVLKPSEMTPSVGLIMAELLSEAGLPDGVFNVVQGGKQTGVALAEHRRIDGLLFTGSAETGDYLRESFGKKPGKILALELGGNNPMVVWDVEDMDTAAIMVVQSAFITAGQRCTCARRLIVPDTVWGESFVKRVCELSSKLVVGAPDSEPTPFMGPVISSTVAGRLMDAQKGLLEKGGKALLEMTHLDPKTGFLSPGIIDVTGIEKREDKEYFGPLLQVIRVESLEEAIQESNDTDFGLASGILTDDVANYHQFYRGARAGLINWNQPLTGASGAAPFGGIGRSGNFNPSAFFAADYCSYPVASLEKEKLEMPSSLLPGMSLDK